MLQNEPPEEVQTAPAQRRVTPEELSAALEALEADKQEQARHVQQTVAIGEVVRELDLNVTPEEIWQQVQAQRAQKPPAPPPPAESKHADTLNDTLRSAAQHAHKLAGQAAAVAQAAAAEAFSHAEARREHRHLQRGRKGIVAAAVALICVGAAVTSTSHQGLVITGDHTTATYSGYHKTAVITGDDETITLRGGCGSLNIIGDHDHIRILGAVTHVNVTGDGDTITWTQEPKGQTPTITDLGDGNQIGPETAAP